MGTITKPTRAQESRAAIRRMYIEMRHLLERGSYKPLGRSGEAMLNSLLDLNPEIYGIMRDTERVELNGLLYVFQRLPQGIESCRYIKLISKEGIEQSAFEPLIPNKRRRNCYRIDDEQMYIEMTRGRSDVYDVLTHLTFMYNEAEKIARNSLNNRDQANRSWQMLKKIIEKRNNGEDYNEELAITYLSTLLGRTYAETARAAHQFSIASQVNDLFTVCYGLGKLSIQEAVDNNDREISFSYELRQQLGSHTYGEAWATNIKEFLHEKNLLERPLHVISSNMHSVMNALYARKALNTKGTQKSLLEWANKLSMHNSEGLRHKVEKVAKANGMYELSDSTGTNIKVQIFDCALIDMEERWNGSRDIQHEPVLLVMDYAFGEQAYETMDELLKPFEIDDHRIPLRVVSINVMGKAGILRGGKGDIMIATAHIFEGSADNYPVNNALSVNDFQESEIPIYEGPMITVLGTSLQNKDVLQYFSRSSWAAVGLEMEGAHYQKAIQAASKIRKSVPPDIVTRYAYYASDNPLESGSTLASGSLGLDGVKPTYAITTKILDGIFESP